jgi:hypothetical protein
MSQTKGPPMIPAQGLFRFSGREFSNRRFTLTEVGSGLGKGRGDLVAVGRGWPPEDCLEIGPGQRPSSAGRRMPIEIGHLPARVRAIARGDPLRRERLAAS